MATFPPSGLIDDFCARLVAHDLPDLPADRGDEAVAFAVRRVAGLPSPTRLGVGVVAVAVAAGGAVLGRRRVVAVLARRPLPVLAEYVRLLRSLVTAYVWATWPDTSATGRPLSPAPADVVGGRSAPGADAAAAAAAR